MRIVLRKIGVVIIIIGLIVLITQNARATLISWTGSGGLAEFDNDSIVFTGIQSDGLNFVGDGLFHTHGSVATLTIDVLADGSWTNIWTVTGLFDGFSNTLSGLGTLSFANSLITGLRMGVNLPIMNVYHSVDSDFINFNDAAPVPEPATLSLLGIGLVGLFGAGARKKLKKKGVENS